MQKREPYQRRHVHRWVPHTPKANPISYNYIGIAVSNSVWTYRLCDDCRAIQKTKAENLVGYPESVRLIADVEWEPTQS